MVVMAWRFVQLFVGFVDLFEQIVGFVDVSVLSFVGRFCFFVWFGPFVDF
jgi:hypothetical protein